MTNIYTYGFLKNDQDGSTNIRSLELPMGINGPVEIFPNYSHQDQGNSVNLVIAIVEPNILIDEIKNDENQLLKAIIKHDAVLRQLFAQINLLPLRFGCVFTLEQSLLNHLVENEDKYLGQLHYFEGKVECNIKFIPVDRPIESATLEPNVTKGRAYFAAKKQVYQLQLLQEEARNQEKEELLQSIELALPLLQKIINENNENNIFCLVRRSDYFLLIEQLENWQAKAIYWTLQIDGPLPPYHFL